MPVNKKVWLTQVGLVLISYFWGLLAFTNLPIFETLSDDLFFSLRFFLYTLCGVWGAYLLRQEKAFKIHWPKKGISLLVMTFVVSLLWNLFMSRIVPQTGNGQAIRSFFNSSSPYLYGLTALKLMLLGPFVEEVIFRGLAMTLLRPYQAYYLDCILPSAVFGLLHVPFKDFSPLEFLIYFVSGLIYAFLMRRSQSLGFCILNHAIWNSFTFLLAIWLR